MSSRKQGEVHAILLIIHMAQKFLLVSLPHPLSQLGHQREQQASIAWPLAIWYGHACLEPAMIVTVCTHNQRRDLHILFGILWFSHPDLQECKGSWQPYQYLTVHAHLGLLPFIRHIWPKHFPRHKFRLSVNADALK